MKLFYIFIIIIGIFMVLISFFTTKGMGKYNVDFDVGGDSLEDDEESKDFEDFKMLVGQSVSILKIIGSIFILLGIVLYFII